MKALKYIMAGLTIIGFSAITQAQNENDALRYSMNKLTGTARFVSMGGAFTSLGGDLSAVNLNPASVGIYRRSEFSASSAFYLQNTSADFNGTNDEASRLNLNFGNFGYLGNFYTGRNKWKSASIFIGYNRTNNFSNEISYNGISPGSSILDGYTADANTNGGTPEDEIFNAFPFGAGLAYNAFLLNPTSGDSLLYNNVLSASENLYQEMNINRSGGMGSYDLAFGGNYNDRIYIGGSVSLTTLRYRQESTYKEIPDQEDLTNDLVELRQYDNLLTTGTGVNFKVGIIGRVTNWLRLGATVHSPTYYRMSDNWSTQLDADYENGDAFREESPNGSFDYRLNTPARVAGGVGFVVGKRGIVSAEYEYIDYSLARLSTPSNSATGSYDFNLENEQIRRLFQPAGVLKIGTEWRLNSFRLRGGFNQRGNAYQDEIGEDNSSTTYSFGVGFREDDYFIDLGYALTQFSQNYYTYSLIENPAEISTNAHSIVLTVGFRF